MTTNRAMEREMADQGELQRGSNLGKGQVKAADYFLQPDIVSTNKNSGGGGVGGFLGNFVGGPIGAIAGGGKGAAIGAAIGAGAGAGNSAVS